MDHPCGIPGLRGRTPWEVIASGSVDGEDREKARKTNEK
jgi:hypothetical protein